MATIQLDDKALVSVRAIVANNIDTSSWRPVIFGSRATGSASRFSDIDLGFIGENRLPESAVSRLWEAFDESDLPYVVDIVDLTTTSAEFRKVAEKNMVNLW